MHKSPGLSLAAAPRHLREASLVVRDGNLAVLARRLVDRADVKQPVGVDLEGDLRRQEQCVVMQWLTCTYLQICDCVHRRRTSICGTPRGAGGMPLSSKLPSR